MSSLELLMIMLTVFGKYTTAQTTVHVEGSTCNGDTNTNTQMERVVTMLESINQRLSRLEENQAHSFINLALGRPAYQSTTYNWGGRTLCKADLAVDGNSDPMFYHSVYQTSCTHTATGEEKPWWAVDLGRPYHVYRIEITGRGDAGNEWLQDVYIGVTDASPLTTTPDITNFSKCTFFKGPLALGETRSFGCDHGTVKGSYVIIQKTSSAPLILCEVKVYGYL